MAWDFEKVFNLTTGTTNNSMATDGKFIWICDESGNIKLIDFWGYDKLNEQEYHKLEDGEWADKLTIHHTISLVGYSDNIVYGQGFMWVLSNDRTKITRIDINDYSTREVDLGIIVNSNIAYGEDKIWYVEESPVDVKPEPQKLYYFNCNTFIKSSGLVLNGIRQLDPTHIAYGKNGFMYITRRQQFNVVKVNTQTGDLVSDIFVNAFPAHIYVDEYLNILVSSVNGMVSKIDNSDVVTHLYGTIDSVNSIQYDGTRFWATNDDNKLLRINKADGNTLIGFTSGGGIGADYEMNLSSGFNEPVKQIIVTQRFTYESWNGSSYDTIIVEPYVFILTSNSINTFRNISVLIKENFASVRGVSMISTGTDDYTGD